MPDAAEEIRSGAQQFAEHGQERWRRGNKCQEARMINAHRKGRHLVLKLSQGGGEALTDFRRRLSEQRLHRFDGSSPADGKGPQTLELFQQPGQGLLAVLVKSAHFRMFERFCASATKLVQS